MKTLLLTAILAVSAPAQLLIDASGAEWAYVATGKDKDGAKFNVWARRVKADGYPTLDVKFGYVEPIRAEHDCKTGKYRLKGGEWARPTRGSMGAKLVKFACKK